MDQIAAERVISFGPFRLLPTQRLLLEGDKRVRLGSRALDILIALVEHRGEVVGKDELIARVWPNTAVEESNLRFQVSALRRALGNRYLANIPGRGYSFVAPVAVGGSPPQPPPPLAAAERAHNLPAPLTQLIGRADIVDRLAAHLPRQRLLTIVGPGGIGKTAVALAVAEQVIAAYEHGVWLVDLAPLADPRLVPSAVAAVIGLEVRSENPLPGLLAFLRDEKRLLVLDNCEHVVDAAAALAFAVLRGAQGVHILATSREPLRVQGERVHRLAALPTPPASSRLSAAEALGFPSLQLFIERAAESSGEFELSDAEAPVVAEICRRLDGIPLAIELAAARIDAFRVRGLLSRLDDRIRLLAHGRRSALPRHRNISAMLDWSYELLTATEQTVFRRLATFAGSFTLEAAGAVTADATHPEGEIIDQVAELVAKSLVVVDASTAEPRLRLLETTRTYALEKLVESGERDLLAQRHAEYYRDLLEAAAPDEAATGELPTSYASHIDSLRAALAWAFARGGDAKIGVALAATSALIWLEMSLFTECQAWMGRALDLLDATDRGTRREMVLQTAFGLSLMFTQGSNSTPHAALTRASELAESLQDLNYQFRSLYGLANICLRLEDFHGGLALCRRGKAIARRIGDPVWRSMADSILSAPLFYLGEYAKALTYAKRAYRRNRHGGRRSPSEWFGYDLWFWARCMVVQILWLQGLPDQAAQATRSVLADAEAAANPGALCSALTWSGCPIWLRLGELTAAEALIHRLQDLAEKHSLGGFYANSVGFAGQLAAKRGDVAAGERLLRASLAKLRQAEHEFRYTPFLSDLAEVLAMAGRLDESLAAADEALQRTERTDAFWWMPEALRIKGDVLVLLNRPEAAGELFRRSLELARRQGALSWELRAAIGLARLQRGQNRVDEARDLLAAVYGRFTEGFNTADLEVEKRFLDQLT